MAQEKILIAMSGGVDSSVAALLLKEQGYGCVGATMKLLTPNLTEAADESDDAKKVADKLGIPFEILDLSADFRRHVVDYFIKTYLAGETPNPCVECNRTMKFGKLLESARALGCDKIATGHYARLTLGANGRWLISSAADASKDQTYVLWSLTQEQLSRTLFPLGEYRKDEIRELALANGFCNAARRDSQDICFIPDGDYVSFIERVTGEHFPAGDFVDLNGNVIGKHNGAIRYTVGQRKGLGISFGRPTYVCGKNTQNNTVTLGSNEDLFSRDLTAHSINLIATDAFPSPTRVLAKVRYNATPAPATVEQTSPSTFSLRFDSPQRAISPGQSVVLYDGSTLLGGGIIKATPHNRQAEKEG